MSTQTDSNCAGCLEPSSTLGWPSPLDAFKHGPREKLIYVTNILVKNDGINPDYIATVDVDPSSPTYSTVIHRTQVTEVGDELHHTGWNACSSCFGKVGVRRQYLVAPGMISGNIYYIDVESNPREPKLARMIKASDIKAQWDLSWPHTVHCLASGDVMVSHMGNADGSAPGGLLLIDDKGKLKGRWDQGSKRPDFHYDYWYQPRHNVLISSEFGEPNTFKNGFDPSKVSEKFGRKLNFWDWTTHEIIDTIDLGEDGSIPLEIRFLHDPSKAHGFVGCALSSSVFHFYKSDGKWKADKVIQVEPKRVEGWLLPEMPGLMTDILISLDDKFLYFSNWLHGDIRQYNIEDPFNPQLVGSIMIGGSLRGHVTLLGGEELPTLPKLGGKTIEGGPQMLQLSLDGKRLYVTDSLFSPWDKQFCPTLLTHGSTMLQIDVNVDSGGLSLNENFRIDFGAEPWGPTLAHEMRFPGGDSTSDVWL